MMILLLIVVLFIAVVLFCAWASNKSAASRPEWRPEPQYNGPYADADTAEGSIGDGSEGAHVHGQPMTAAEHTQLLVDSVPSRLHTDWSKLEHELNEVR